MPLGPVEILVIAFPESRFNGQIAPEVQKLIDRGIINVVDGLLIMKSLDGDVNIIEFEQMDLEPALEVFKALFGELVYDLVSAEDAEEFAKAIEPGDSALVLAFENVWAKPFVDAVVASGGEVMLNMRIPNSVITEVLEEIVEA